MPSGRGVCRTLVLGLPAYRFVRPLQVFHWRPRSSSCSIRLLSPTRHPQSTTCPERIHHRPLNPPTFPTYPSALHRYGTPTPIGRWSRDMPTALPLVTTTFDNAGRMADFGLTGIPRHQGAQAQSLAGFRTPPSSLGHKRKERRLPLPYSRIIPSTLQKPQQAAPVEHQSPLCKRGGL